MAWLLRSRLIPWLPLPSRLPFGGRWLAWNDVLGRCILLNENFEQGERSFLLRFLEPGMTVLDIGANQGLYSLLAAKKVGSGGRVIAFEPSPRELRRLRWNLKMNRCRNVRVEPVALGSQEGVGELYVCLGQETGCNSLRPPAVSEPVSRTEVAVATLDQHLAEMDVEKADFVKVDVEGAELDVFRGGGKLLSDFRPIIMCELADVRTEPWGYRSAEVYDLLKSYGYHWFSINTEGRLQRCPKRVHYHENLVAVPQEKLDDVKVHIDGEGG